MRGMRCAWCATPWCAVSVVGCGRGVLLRGIHRDQTHNHCSKNKHTKQNFGIAYRYKASNIIKPFNVKLPCGHEKINV